MNFQAISLELGVVVLGLGLLLLDLWSPPPLRRQSGYVGAFGLALILICSFLMDVTEAQYAFEGRFVLDPMALFFKRFFLLAGVVVLVLSVEFADRFASGVSEYYSLVMLALAGMMLCASANDFAVLFVSVELITVTFYILTSFQRGRRQSLEAGVKYLILGALSSAFLVYGIALVYGSVGETSFQRLSERSNLLVDQPFFQLGLLLVLVGLGFKIAMFPFQVWAPDVYQGAPTPTTAFLAVGSKGAGMALLLRLLYGVVPNVAGMWDTLLMALATITILYGSLCAIPQRNLKRLLGYSSIANAGYLLLGIAVLSRTGTAAVLYYLAGYLFTVMTAFIVIGVAMRTLDDEDMDALSGLNRRSPLLAAAMTLSMVSLAGVPPLAGFFGKFLLLRAVVEQMEHNPAYGWVIAAALAGVVISLYYYFGVIRAMYWPRETPGSGKVEISDPMRWSLYACVLGMFLLGLFPDPVLRMAEAAARVLY